MAPPAQDTPAGFAPPPWPEGRFQSARSVASSRWPTGSVGSLTFRVCGGFSSSGSGSSSAAAMVSGSGASGGKGSFGMPVVYPARPPGTRIRPGHPTVPLIDRAFHLQRVGALAQALAVGDQPHLDATPRSQWCANDRRGAIRQRVAVVSSVVGVAGPPAGPWPTRRLGHGPDRCCHLARFASKRSLPTSEKFTSHPSLRWSSRVTACE